MMSCFAQAPDEPDFALFPADVPKVVVLMYASGQTILEVTYTPGKQAELAALVASHLNKPIRIMLDGKIAAERTFSSATVGHSIKINEPSPEAAFAIAKDLLKRTH
ncbi:MAG TPA: hypothetical protein VHY22_18510 [Chthoniobacteraceae bacterium]|nr:hypothetical protein [Chthoniobacteraceae bacterium]